MTCIFKTDYLSLWILFWAHHQGCAIFNFSKHTNPTQWDHSVTVGTYSSPRGSPGPQKGLLGPRWAFWGPDGPFGPQMSPLGPPKGTEKAPEWTNMTYYHVLYPSKVFQGHFDPSGALSGAHVNFFQWGTFWVPQECGRGLLRGQSTWYVCGPPSGNIQWQLGLILAPRGVRAPKRAFRSLDGPFGAQMGPFGPPVGTEKAPEWANMTYYHVLYPNKVFQGHFDPSRALSGAHVNFFQWGTFRDWKFQYRRTENFLMGGHSGFFLKYYWLKRAPLVRLGQIWRWCFWEKSTFLHTLFGPKTAIFWPRRAPFDPKPQKHSVTSCFNPKHCIPGLKLVSEQKWQFWGRQTPPNPPRAPQTPPGVRGGQKWLWCTCPSPVLIISDKKMIFEGVNILTHFFPRTHPEEIINVAFIVFISLAKGSVSFLLLAWDCVKTGGECFANSI